MRPTNIQWPLVKEYAINFAQAAGTYDITTAVGDVLIENYCIYVATAGATFTSAALFINDTTPFNLMTAVEGAVANLTAGKNMVPANQGKAMRVTSGKKIQLTMVGSTGTGTAKLVVTYYPISSGATI